MPPRPHPAALTAVVAACMFVALLVLPGALARAEWPRPGASSSARPATPSSARPATPSSARSATPLSAPPATPSSARPATPSSARPDWRWPLRGPVVGHFRLTPRAPYARGQRRGIDVAAAPGSLVRAACPGRVTFTGALPRQGLAVSVRCGALVATYLRLARVTVRRGSTVASGQPLGTLGPLGRLRLGARRAADRRGYLDPMTLLRDPGPSPPDLGPAPRRQRRRTPPRAARPRPLPAPAPLARPAAALARERPGGLPWSAYPALALIATAFPVGGVVHRRRRRTATAIAAHDGP